MQNNIDDRKLVELRMSKDQMDIALNGEQVKDAILLTGILQIRYPGSDFRDHKDRDLGDLAIFERAPTDANAYLRGPTSTERIIMCGDSTTTAMYFQINREQAEKYARQVKVEPFVDLGNIPDGEAD